MASVKFRCPVPAKRCDVVEYIGGPHEGCNEFAPLVRYRCRNAATHVLKGRYLQVVPEAGCVVLASSKEWICEFHAEIYIRDPEPGHTMYRFRVLDK